MGRPFFLSVLLALLIGAMPAAFWPASVSSFASAEPTACAGDFEAKLRCWWDRTPAEKRVEVTLARPLALDGSAALVNWPDYADAARRGRLMVSVPGGHASGAGGTVLLILAGERHVAPDSKITRLSAATLDALAPVCDTKLCDLVGPVTGKEAVAGKALLDAKVATETSSGRPWGVLFVVALVLLVALLGFTVLRTRGLRFSTGYGDTTGPSTKPRPPDAPDHTYQPGAPGAPRAAGAPEDRRRHRRRHGRLVDIPPGPRRTAIVRSDLHPQGYVEVDRCLFRAVWADHQTPAPDVGASVDVVQGAGQDSDILLALPPGTGH